MADEEKYSVVKNENPALVREAKINKGQEGGIVKGGIIKVKEGAKKLPRVEVPLYNKVTDNQPLPDKNPFSKEIKDKNDKARNLIIPLLNAMGKDDRIRLNAISLEIQQEIVALEKEPEPDEEKIEDLKSVEKSVTNQIEVGEEGEKGIVFPPKDESPPEDEKPIEDDEKSPTEDEKK